MVSHPRARTVAVFSWRVSRINNLAQLCGVERVLFWPRDAQASEVDAVLAWGQKPSGRRGLDYATRHDKPVWRVEDGFVRSVGLGVAGDPPLSVVIDDQGIYYDARKRSRLEWLLDRSDAEDPELLGRANRAIAALKTAGLSKYNDAPPASVVLEPRDRPRVLVVDQTAGDLSVRCGLARPSSFTTMLEAALDENPDAEIVVKTHPDVLAGKKRGYLERPSGGRIRLFTQRVEPFSFLAQMDRAYVVTSQLGFESLLAGLDVTCFGVPWYAGWGATQDRVDVPRRGKTRSVAALFAAAYLRYARYLQPDTGQPGELEDVVDHLALQRETFRKNAGRIFCVGFRFWKRGYMRSYLRCPGNEVRFVDSADQADREGFDADSRLMVWGQRETADIRTLGERHGVTISRVEDGFLRSVGLGSDLAMPASLVFDESGIYYDPSTPSDLEKILQDGTFDDGEITRAKRLRETIVGARLSKYNVGGDDGVTVPEGREVVLVPGQVEDDASIQLGCREVRTNLALIAAARKAHPDAYIIYKPHPDVLSGNRKGAVSPTEARSHCDHIETSATLASCVEVASAVHTMTSLVGFESLLRDKHVTVYGQPFYSGWGLTTDHHPMARRTRRLTLDELVAGTLIRYPRYLDRDSGRFTTPERTIDKLLLERDASDERQVQIGWVRRQLRKVAHVYKGLVHAP